MTPLVKDLYQQIKEKQLNSFTAVQKHEHFDEIKHLLLDQDFDELFVEFIQQPDVMGQFAIDARILKELSAGRTVEGDEGLVRKHEQMLEKYYELQTGESQLSEEF